MFTQKISMDCTQEQYEKYLKEELLKMGYEEENTSCWDDKKNCYISNNYSLNGTMGNEPYQTAKSEEMNYLGKFNAPLFLALAAMTDKKLGGIGEYWVLIDKNLSFTKNELYKCVGLFLDKTPKFIDDIGELNGFDSRFFFEFIRKATVSEIMAKFGEKEYRYNGRPSWEIILDTTIIEEMTKQHREMWAAYKKLNEKIEEKSYEPKNGEYFALISKDWSRPIIAISNGEVKRGADGLGAYAHLNFLGGLENRGKFGYQLYDILRPVTLEEIAILDSKLAEQGKFFNKETMRIEEIKKEPIIGEMVIGWELNKKEAIVGVLNDVYEYCKDMLAYKISGRWLRNIIPFESTEQYKNLIKNA